MLKLIVPDISHKEQWEEIMEEWDDSRKRPRIFFKDTYEQVLERVSTLKEKDDIENQVAKSSLYFLQDTERKRLVGFYWFRHNLKFRDDAKLSGHIGYGIRPSERGKGYAKHGLSLVLDEARNMDFKEVMICCDDDNIASAKVIEANGGILDSYVSNSDGVKRRRYWIELFKEEKQILQSLELELLQFETRHNPARLDELLADDFFECGASGDIFGKKECIKSLPQETKEKTIEYREMTVHILSETLAQIRWKAKITHPGNPPKCSFRSSLWRKSENGWQMFFHQGTLME